MFPAVLSLTLFSLLHQVTSLGSTCSTVVNKPIAAAYFAGWHATEGFSLSNVSWEKYTTLLYSFAATTPDVSSLSLNGSDPSLLPEFVSKAHENGVEAVASVGGWSGGRWFSSNVASPQNRTAFVKTVIDFADKYELDGINFDWEYPAKQGVGCNTVNANDTENFLDFLQELRKDPLGAKLKLSASTGITPFIDASGTPLKNVSSFANLLDYITVMNYDVWGSWSSTVGPNSPLNDTCAPSADQEGSAVSAVAAWTAAGMPADQIVLGVAAYGHSFSVPPSEAFDSGSSTTLVANPKFNASNPPIGGAWDNTSGDDVCGVFQKSGGTYTMWGLVDAGFLTEDGKPASGIYYRYDTCSQTPYVYNKTSEVMISFQDAEAFTASGKYIKEVGLRGFSMWEAGGDYQNILLDAIRSGAGFEDSYN